MKKSETFIICKTSVINMQQVKKSVTARIPIELYDKCNQQYENMTDAIIIGLETLCNQSETICKTDVINMKYKIYFDFISLQIFCNFDKPTSKPTKNIYNM